MADAKPLASLSSGLLARKGGASPAMRRQPAIGQSAGSAEAFGTISTAQDDLGWNDMGYDVDPDQSPDDVHSKNVADMRPMLSPMPANAAPLAQYAPASVMPAIVQQQDNLAQVFAAAVAGAGAGAGAGAEPKPAPVASAVSVASRKPRERAGAKGKYAFTLRIDPDRHIKLRLASALQNVSAQNMLTDALDQLLASVPGLEALATQARATK